MRKQELIHIHALFREVSEHLERNQETRIETPTYDELGTRPTSIHKGKPAHKEAVFALSDDIVDSFTLVSEATAPPADD